MDNADTMAPAGALAVPRQLLQSQSRLKLDAEDLVLLLNVMELASRPDHPGRGHAAVLAARAGISSRTVYRRLRRMEQNRLLARTRHVESGCVKTLFDLDGLGQVIADQGRAG